MGRAVVRDGRCLGEVNAVALLLAAAAAKDVEPGCLNCEASATHVLREVRSLAVHHSEVKEWPQPAGFVELLEVRKPYEWAEPLDRLADICEVPESIGASAVIKDRYRFNDASPSVSPCNRSNTEPNQ